MAGRPQGDERLRTVGLLVLDEAHYLGDQDRGTVWEEVIISALPHIRILAMSATISNAQQLGSWLTQARARCCAACSRGCHGHACVACVSLSQPAAAGCLPQEACCQPRYLAPSAVDWATGHSHKHVRLGAARPASPDRLPGLTQANAQVHRPCQTLVSDYRPVPLTWLYCKAGPGGRAVLSPLLDQPPAAEPEELPLPAGRMSRIAARPACAPPLPTSCQPAALGGLMEACTTTCSIFVHGLM